MNLLNILLAIISMFFVDYFSTTRIILIIALVFNGGLKLKKGIEKKSEQITIIANGISIALLLLSFVLNSFSLMTVGQILVIASGIWNEVSIAWKERGSHRKKTIFKLVLLTTCGLFALLLMIESISPIFLLKMINSAPQMAVQQESSLLMWEEQYYRKSNIMYESTYPNNYFDLYSPDKELVDSKPVFIYIHGGGYVWGDKATGDPNADDTMGLFKMFKELMNQGFRVISVNYALAPEYRYPTPMYQMSEFIVYLQNHAEEYGIDMHRIVIGGGSAGGHITGQFVALQTNDAYADELQIEQVLEKSDIKAVYFGCALLDNERFGHTSSKIVDYLFYQMGRTYFKAGFLQGNDDVCQSNVIEHITEDFPPTYVTDGNAATFNEQARDLEIQLEQYHIPNHALIYDNTKKSILHGYDTGSSTEALENIDEMLCFISEHVLYK